MRVDLVPDLPSAPELNVVGVEEVIELVFYVPEGGVFVDDLRHLQPVLDF